MRISKKDRRRYWETTFKLMDLASLCACGGKPNGQKPMCGVPSPSNKETCNRNESHDGPHIALTNSHMLVCPPWDKDGYLWESE